MNQRIRELLSKAGLKTETMLDDSSRDVECVVTVYDRSIPSIENMTKFAELIVKETLEVARAGVEFGDGMEDAVYKYFGVEQ